MDGVQVGLQVGFQVGDCVRRLPEDRRTLIERLSKCAVQAALNGEQAREPTDKQQMKAALYNAATSETTNVKRKSYESQIERIPAPNCVWSPYLNS